MNRRRFLTSATAAGLVVNGKPASAASDPLLDLIRHYRQQLVIFNASGDLSDDENNALAAATIDPPWQRLRDDCPIPTTLEGAIEGIRLADKEYRETGTGGVEEGILPAVVAYFDGRSA